jgi:peptidoglycan hydrolase-like protein with peptidoglycan-binding domain
MTERGFAIAVDGMYGSKSKGACQTFQQQESIDLDEIVGPHHAGAHVRSDLTDSTDRLRAGGLPPLPSRDLATARRRLFANRSATGAATMTKNGDEHDDQHQVRGQHEKQPEREQAPLHERPVQLDRLRIL